MKAEVRFAPLAALCLLVLWYGLFYEFAPLPVAFVAAAFALASVVANSVTPGLYDCGLDGYALGSALQGVSIAYGVVSTVLSVVFIVFLPGQWRALLLIQATLLVVYALLARWIVRHDRRTLEKLGHRRDR